MSRPGHLPAPPSEEELQRFGYRQEFRRELKRFTSFAVVFSFISVTTGIFTTYGSLLNWGGRWASGRGQYPSWDKKWSPWFSWLSRLVFPWRAIPINGLPALPPR